MTEQPTFQQRCLEQPYYTLGDLNNRKSFSYISGGWKVQVKVWQHLVSDESYPPGLQMATFLLSPYTALPLCSAVFSISLSSSLPKIITSGVRVSTYQFGSQRAKGRDTNIQSITRGNTCLDWVVRKHELFSEAWVQNTVPGLKQYGNSF